MKRNFLLKFLITLIFVSILVSILAPLNIFAMDTEYMKPDQFDSYNKLSDMDVGNKKIGGIIQDGFGVVLTIVRTIALGWAIIMAVSIATKYMTGSAQIKSQLKTDLPTYIIGAVILFGAYGILTLIQYFVGDVLS